MLRNILILNLNLIYSYIGRYEKKKKKDQVISLLNGNSTNGNVQNEKVSPGPLLANDAPPKAVLLR